MSAPCMPAEADALERERVSIRNRLTGEHETDRRIGFRLLVVESRLAELRGYLPPPGPAPVDTMDAEDRMHAAALWLWDQERQAAELRP